MRGRGGGECITYISHGVDRVPLSGWVLCFVNYYRRVNIIVIPVYRSENWGFLMLSNLPSVTHHVVRELTVLGFEAGWVPESRTDTLTTLL